MGKRRRCPFCRCLFWPDSRVRDRQWACKKPACQTKRRAKTQARWRASHPEDGRARRFRAEIAATKATGKAALPRPPPGGLPWEELRDEITPQSLVIIGFFVRLGSRAAKDEIRSQVRVIMNEMSALVPREAKDETA